MRRNFEFSKGARYSKDGRRLDVPTFPGFGLCTKVVKLPRI